MNIYLKVLIPSYIVVEAETMEEAVLAAQENSVVLASSYEPMDEEEEEIDD